MAKASSDASFTAQAKAEEGGDRPDNTGRATVAAQVTAFDAYQARPDIESRDSILAREQAQPGSLGTQEDPSQPNMVDGEAVPA